MVNISGLHKDFFASHIRSQIDILKLVLLNIENSESFEFEYVAESLRKVESDVHRVRNFLKAGLIKVTNDVSQQ